MQLVLRLQQAALVQLGKPQLMHMQIMNSLQVV
nr:MAG TPA: hypothetical protein [Caudoviricetes sp.]